MFIVSKYKIVFKPQTEIHILENVQDVGYCPLCGGELEYYDHCKRIVLEPGHEKTLYEIRRFRCLRCGTLHRELPDCITPHKHYSTQVIAEVLDGSLAQEVLDEENYPCTGTIQDWNQWSALNQPTINQVLLCCLFYILGVSGDVPWIEKDSLLDQVRVPSEKWLEGVIYWVYNTGERLVPFRSVHAGEAGNGPPP